MAKEITSMRPWILVEGHTKSSLGKYLRATEIDEQVITIGLSNRKALARQVVLNGLLLICSGTKLLRKLIYSEKLMIVGRGGIILLMQQHIQLILVAQRQADTHLQGTVSELIAA